MKTYEVTIMRTGFTSITVNAKDPDQAESLAWNVYQGDADSCVSNEIFGVEEIGTVKELEIESN
jgi:hypothetical protein